MRALHQQPDGGAGETLREFVGGLDELTPAELDELMETAERFRAGRAAVVRAECDEIMARPAGAVRRVDCAIVGLGLHVLAEMAIGEWMRWLSSGSNEPTGGGH